MTEAKIQKWIKARLESVPAAALFELFDLRNGGRSTSAEIVFSFKREARPIADLSQARAEECWRAAVECAALSGNKQKFELHAYGANRSKLSKLQFFAHPEPAAPALARPIMGTSEATEKGLLGQLMRHNQQLASINVEAMQAVLQPLISENQDLRRRISEADSRRLEWFELCEGLQGKKHEREALALEAASKAELKGRLGQALTEKWIPELISRLDIGPRKLACGEDLDLERGRELMRQALGCVDRADLARQLNAAEKMTLDALCGIGDGPQTSAEFRESLRHLWSTLPEQVSENLVRQISSRPDLAAQLSNLLETSDVN